MSGADWSILGATFLGGAFPWLEAIFVIPAGILAGAPAALVLISGVVGNLLTVWLAAAFGEQLREWWLRRRAAKRAAAGPESVGGESVGSAHPEKKRERRRRIDRIMARWGLPGLALLGPLGLGTQISALVAVGMGVRWRVAFVWVGLGTVLWASVAAVLTVFGVSVFTQ